MSKKTLRKVTSMALAAAMAVSVLSGCGAKSTKSTDAAAQSIGGGDTIRIGLTVPLTGDRATEGSYGSNAAKIVQEEINANGGVLGKNIEIVIEDSLGTDVGATTAYLKLASEEDITAIIGSDNSSDNIAIAGSVESSQVKIGRASCRERV